MRSIVAVTTLVVLLGGAIPRAHASTVLFSDLGPGDTFMEGVAWNIANAFVGDIAQGSAFTPAQTATLDSIAAALTFIEGANEIDLLLMTDSNGLPSTVLERFHFTNLPALTGAPFPLSIGTSVLHPLLLADTQYWIIAEAAGAPAFGGFNQNSTGYTGVATRVNHEGFYFTPDYPAAAFRVEGTTVGGVPVPEPASVLLFGLGAVAAGMRRCRRDQ